jgi:hypothetical protein
MRLAVASGATDAAFYVVKYISKSMASVTLNDMPVDTLMTIAELVATPSKSKFGVDIESF